MRQWPLRRLEIIGYVASITGGLALAILIGREMATWGPSVPPTEQKYIGQRILYVLGTNTDFPVVQIILTGIACTFVARRRKRSGSPADRENCHADAVSSQAAPRVGS